MMKTGCRDECRRPPCFAYGQLNGRNLLCSKYCGKMSKFWTQTGLSSIQLNKAGETVPRQRSYSRVTHQALAILGKLIRVGRAGRGLTAQELADRAGISRTTLSSIERGAPSPEIGIVFEVAALVGVRLFEYDERTLQIHHTRLDEKLTLLPKSVRHSLKEADDDF